MLPDPDGKRVGSGGATFNVMAWLAGQEGGSSKKIFKNKRILVIHSGGDSKRIPQYSVCGKLFHRFRGSFLMAVRQLCLMSL